MITPVVPTGHLKWTRLTLGQGNIRSWVQLRSGLKSAVCIIIMSGLLYKQMIGKSHDFNCYQFSGPAGVGTKRLGFCRLFRLTSTQVIHIVINN